MPFPVRRALSWNLIRLAWPGGRLKSWRLEVSEEGFSAICRARGLLSEGQQLEAFVELIRRSSVAVMYFSTFAKYDGLLCEGQGLACYWMNR